MTTQTVTPIPPRPSWMRHSRDDSPVELPPQWPAAPPAIPREEPVPEGVQQRRLLRSAGNTSAGVLVSAMIHIAILLLLNLWYFATRPGASGYVINCEIQTEDNGAATEQNSVVQAPVPEEPPPAEEKPAPAPSGGGAGEEKVARIGGGAGDGDGAGGGGVGFFGTKAEGNSFVFIVDRSGSMKNGRLTVAKQELNRAIGTLRPNQKFYVLFYNSDMERMLSPSPPAGLVFATPEMRDQVRRWIRPVPAKGGTEPAESFQTALEMRPDVIFFLTDGQIPESTAAVVRENNFHGTVIHTTALVSQEGETILQRIAADHGGTYRHVGGASGNPELSARAARDLAKRLRAAEAKLRFARKHLREGRPLSGRRWLEEVIQEYPGTTQASEARKLMLEL